MKFNKVATGLREINLYVQFLIFKNDKSVIHIDLNLVRIIQQHFSRNTVVRKSFVRLFI